MKIYTLTLLLLFTYFTSAQDIDSLARVKKHQFKVNLLLTPNLDYEVGLSKTITLNFQAGLFPVAIENRQNDESRFTTVLGSKLSFRHYYNLNRRLQKDKSIDNNSGNYFGISSWFAGSDPIIFNTSIEISDSYYSEIGAIYGLQRVFFNKLSLNVESGLGVNFTDLQDPKVIPLLHLNLGWILF